MNTAAHTLAWGVMIGVGATMLMDIWLLIQKQIKIPVMDFALLGRWIGHLPEGIWHHNSIASSPSVRHEKMLGWFAHYSIGVVFALILIVIEGPEWLAAPRFIPAVLVGIGTLVAPLFVLQPAMGAGIASSKTRTPIFNCLKSLINHMVFGGGLYLTGVSLVNLNTQLFN